MMTPADFDKILRQDHRLRRNKVWCDAAHDISVTMNEKHGFNLLVPKQSYRLAIRLKEEAAPYDIMRIWHHEPSGASIHAKLLEIKESLRIVASFSKSVNAARSKIDAGAALSPDDRKYIAAVKEAGKQAQKWEENERKEYANEINMWLTDPGAEGSNSASKPSDRLSGHIDHPSFFEDGISISNADIMLNRWLQQAVFIDEIFRLSLRSIDKKAKKNDSSPNMYLAARWAPDLYRRTYGRSSLGNPGEDGKYKNAAGYTFVVMALKAVTGQVFAPNTIRDFIRMARKS